jgi:hypothetical protein
MDVSRDMRREERTFIRITTERLAVAIRALFGATVEVSDGVYFRDRHARWWRVRLERIDGRCVRHMLNGGEE